jgi:hypothetical protein
MPCGRGPMGLLLVVYRSFRAVSIIGVEKSPKNAVFNLKTVKTSDLVLKRSITADHP